VVSLKINEAIEETCKLIRCVNKYLEQQAPWKVIKTSREDAGRILYTATEALRISALHLSPIMPSKTEEVLNILEGVDSTTQWGGLKEGTKLKSHEALFPRIEKE